MITMQGIYVCVFPLGADGNWSLALDCCCCCRRCCWLLLADVGWWCPAEEGRQNRMEAKSWSLGYRRGCHPCNLMYSQNSGLDIWQHSKADIEKVFERG